MTRSNRNGRGRVIRKRPVGRGAMYGRRSQSKRKQENSFAYQVEVAMKRARDVNVPLAVDAALVAEAERTGACNIGDLYVDDGSHPSSFGNEITAREFYRVIFGEVGDAF